MAIRSFFRPLSTRAEQHVEASFGHADPEHFAWQTRAPYVADRERELVHRAFMPLGERILDVGCGEGATLFHLGAPAAAVGVDLFEGKLELARRELPACRFVRADARQLPFPERSFDHVLLRDVLHHVDDVDRVLGECARVLAPGGRIDVLEPCRYNPLVLAHAIVTPAERGELRSTQRWLERVVARRFGVERVTPLQALPLHRLALHPRLGKPALASSKTFGHGLARAERLAERVMPRFAWAYIHVRATAGN
jgi:SAM-dependent methyltransferase